MESQTESQNSTSGITYVHTESESFRHKIVKVFMGLTSRKTALAKKLSAGESGNVNVPEPPNNLKKDFDVTSSQINNRNVFLLAPKQDKTGKHVIYLHGGAYVHGATNFHWNFVKKLMEELKCSVIFPDYPLAPQQTYLDSFEFMENVYKDVITRVDPKDIVIMGDSSGGGLTLAFSQKLKTIGSPQPSQIILLAPWLDVTLSNPEIKEVEEDDKMNGVESLRMAGKVYGKGLDDLSHYLVSPVNGDLEGLPKISMFMGTHDILLPDARKLKKLCDEKNIPINYYEYPKMQHCWMLAGFLPESQKVLEQIKALMSN